jgi:hypothetical protein
MSAIVLASIAVVLAILALASAIVAIVGFAIDFKNLNSALSDAFGTVDGQIERLNDIAVIYYPERFPDSHKGAEVDYFAMDVADEGDLEAANGN